MNIRLAHASDQNNLLRLFDEFSIFLDKKNAVPPSSGVMVNAILKKEDTYVFVAEEGEQLIAMVTVYLLPNPRRGSLRAHIEDFYVTKKSQGKGVGSAIFLEIKNFCKKNNVSAIKLSSGNELLDAHRFYEKLGGKTTERFFRFDI